MIATGQSVEDECPGGQRGRTGRHLANVDVESAERSVVGIVRREPNLQAGRWVVCDRFTDATYAYQGGGRQLSVGPIRDLENMVQGTRRPDLTVLLDAPVERALARAAARNAGSVQDRFELERSEFFERVRSVYRARAAAEPQRIALVDATQSVDKVGSDILEQLRARSWIS